MPGACAPSPRGMPAHFIARALAALCALLAAATACAPRQALRPDGLRGDAQGEHDWREWTEPPLLAAPGPSEEDLARRAKAVAAAGQLVGLRSLRQRTRSVPDDCSGLVRMAFRAAGGEPRFLEARRGDNAVTALWRAADARGGFHGQGTPMPGDLVFFRETYDRNRDGRRNDGLTHVGVVESVDPDGVVTFIHRGSRGVVRARVDPLRPAARRADDGRVLNDYLRRAEGAHRPMLAGELFAGFASAEVWLFPEDRQADSRRAPGR